MDRKIKENPKEPILSIYKSPYDETTQDLQLIQGAPLICRINDVKNEIVNNDDFTLTSWCNGYVNVKNSSTTFSISLKDFHRYFYPNYCSTVHKAQGQTYDTPYTIWDMYYMTAGYKHYDKRLLYTALSRTTKKSQ